MISKARGNVKGPLKPIILDFGSTRVLKIMHEKILCRFCELFVLESYNLENRKCRKRRVPETAQDPSRQILKILIMGSIYNKNETDILLVFNSAAGDISFENVN